MEAKGVNGTKMYGRSRGPGLVAESLGDEKWETSPRLSPRGSASKSFRSSPVTVVQRPIPWRTTTISVLL